MTVGAKSERTSDKNGTLNEEWKSYMYVHTVAAAVLIKAKQSALTSALTPAIFWECVRKETFCSPCLSTMKIKLIKFCLFIKTVWLCCRAESAENL